MPNDIIRQLNAFIISIFTYQLQVDFTIFQAFLYLVSNYDVSIQNLILNENKVKSTTVKAIKTCLQEGSQAGSGTSTSDSTPRSSDPNSTASSILGSPIPTMPREPGDPLGANTNYWSVSGDTQGTLAWATPSQTLNGTYTVGRVNPRMVKSGTQKALQKKADIEKRRLQQGEVSDSSEDAEDEDEEETESDAETTDSGQYPRAQRTGHLNASGQGPGTANNTSSSYRISDSSTEYAIHEAYRAALESKSPFS